VVLTGSIHSIQARRCRYAQYRGEKATLKLNGLSVTGMVRSVLEDKSTTPTHWIVSILVQIRSLPIWSAFELN
jgi:hypothetical protein